MEDDQNGRRPKWKTTKMEDDQNGRRPKWKTTKMEDDQNGRRPKWKTTKMKTTKVEDDQNGRRPKWKTTIMEDDQNGIQPKWKQRRIKLGYFQRVRVLHIFALQDFFTKCPFCHNGFFNENGSLVSSLCEIFTFLFIFIFGFRFECWLLVWFGMFLFPSSRRRKRSCKWR